MKPLNNYISEKLYISKDYKCVDIYELICGIGKKSPDDEYAYTQKRIKGWIKDNDIKKVECYSDFDPNDIEVIDKEWIPFIKQDKEKVQKLFNEATESNDFSWKTFDENTDAYIGPNMFFFEFTNNENRNWDVYKYYLVIIKSN